MREIPAPSTRVSRGSPSVKTAARNKVFAIREDSRGRLDTLVTFRTRVARRSAGRWWVYARDFLRETAPGTACLVLGTV